MNGIETEDFSSTPPPAEASWVSCVWPESSVGIFTIVVPPSSKLDIVSTKLFSLLAFTGVIFSETSEVCAINVSSVGTILFSPNATCSVLCTIDSGSSSFLTCWFLPPKF